MIAARDARRLTATRQLDPDGNPKAFRLGRDDEQITLEPGKTWAQLDSYKWVTRGLIEEPHGFHVLPNGAVQVHGDEIELCDPDGLARLEERINQRLEAPVQKISRGPTPSASLAESGAGPNKVRFKVRLDKLGHLMVASIQGTERTETGIRGLEGLVRNGLMLKPRTVHIDPLLRYVEIDEARFDSSAAGAEALENRLNSAYAPVLKDNGHTAIEIRPNSAAPSGFDIHFSTFRAGARFEIKGHLSQEHLDVLTDPIKCQLLRPGIVLRISPPHLIIRRRRPDGGEEKIPELPDIHYLRVTAGELQRILNHPLLRRGGAAAETQAEVEEQRPPEITEIRIVRNGQSKMFLSMELVSAGRVESKALTHHNVAELQQAGVFRANIEVVLSLDNRTLSVFDSEADTEDRVVIDHSAADADLAKGAQMMTAALKPAARTAPEPAPPAVQEPEVPVAPMIGEPILPEKEEPRVIADTPAIVPLPRPVPESAPESIRVQEEEPVPAPIPEDNPAIRALFSESDPLRVNREVFRRLEACLGLARQDVRLSLERVFEDRRFEILSFTHGEVSDVLEIRSDEFVGFYLSHINEEKVLLDYAHEGKRIEWGPKRCFFQAGVTADPEEFGQSALLGMAITEDKRYGFIVTPEFKKWIEAREKLYREVPARFITVEDLAEAPGNYPLVWPVPES